MNLNQMKRIASKSDHKSFLHCAMIFSGSRLLSYGYNSGSTHAEVNAVKRLDRLYRVGIENSPRPKNLHMISFMFRRKTGSVGNSFPCHCCMEIIKQASIQSVTWFDGEEAKQLEIN